MKSLIICLIALFFSPYLKASTTMYCSHSELCKMAKIIANENKITDITFDTLVNISGDPHEYEPSTIEIKNLISSPVLITGPNELNPWIKKINFQRSKIPTQKTISLIFTPEDLNFYPNATGEALSHFWIYPKVYCSLKLKLEGELKKINPKIQLSKSCDYHAIEDKLKSALAKINMPIILTHNALLPLLLNLEQNSSRPIVAIKGSGHHEEASTDSVKKMYDALKAPKALWIEETGINIPQNILNKVRSTDKIIKLDTANSKDLNAFSVLTELTEKLELLSSGKS